MVPHAFFTISLVQFSAIKIVQSPSSLPNEEYFANSCDAGKANELEESSSVEASFSKLMLAEQPLETSTRDVQQGMQRCLLFY